MHHSVAIASFTFTKAGLGDLDRIAKEFVAKAKQIPVWLFYGDMGAGKTTFIKSVARELGATDVVSSPTFSIVNEYKGQENSKIFHFDFYRLKNEMEAYDIGVEEYFYSGQYCLVEWPEKIPGFIPANRAEVTIQTEDIDYRTIAIALHDRKEENRV